MDDPFFDRPVPARSRDRLTEAEQKAIDKAIREGNVTKCAPGESGYHLAPSPVTGNLVWTQKDGTMAAGSWMRGHPKKAKAKAKASPKSKGRHA